MDMKKAKLMLLMLLCSVMAAFAGNENEKEMGTDNTNSTVPAWEFIYSVAQPTEQQLDQISGNAEFSKQTSFLFDQLKGLCVKRIPVVPGDPTTRIVIKKGDLFNAAKRVSKGLEEDVNDHKMSEAEATEKMNQVLNVAISAFYSEDSKSFEKALRNNKKDYQQLCALFSKVALK